MAGLAGQLETLASMSQSQLRAEWRRWHKGQLMPVGLGRDLATRAIAWAMQERVHGGLTPAVTRQLRGLANELEETGDIEIGKALTLKPGTKLTREWHGQIYHVLVMEEGFQFQDRHYRSLTPIAREITGVHWSGPRFFGLKEKASVV